MTVNNNSVINQISNYQNQKQINKNLDSETNIENNNIEKAEINNNEKIENLKFSVPGKI